MLIFQNSSLKVAFVPSLFLSLQILNKLDVITFNFIWQSDQQKMMNSSRIHVDSAVGSLHIYSVKKEDGGTYVCQAINKVGQASQEVELKILSMSHYV